MGDDLLTCDVPRVQCDGAMPAIETYSHPVVITWRWPDLIGDVERYLDARIQTPTIIAIRGLLLETCGHQRELLFSVVPIHDERLLVGHDSKQFNLQY
jgi:hypothetical protein